MSRKITVETLTERYSHIRQGYALRSIKVEAITKLDSDETTGYFMVTRTWGKSDWTVCYHDCFRIGPRGGCKVVYENELY